MFNVHILLRILNILALALVCHALVSAQPAAAQQTPLYAVSDIAINVESLSGVNEAGQVVGTLFNLADGQDHAFVWDSSHGLLDLGSDSQAFANNDSGQVIGLGGNAPGAFLWDRAHGMQHLGDPSSIARAINASGQVVGNLVTADGHTHAFLWDRVHGLQDLGTLPGFTDSGAAAINSAGLVIGQSYNSDVTHSHAFLWDRVHGMQDLGTLGGLDSSAVAI